MSTGFVSRSGKTINEADGTTRPAFTSNLYKMSTFVPKGNWDAFRQRLAARSRKLVFTLIRFDSTAVVGGYLVTLEWEYTARSGGRYLSDGVGQLASLVYGSKTRATMALVKTTEYYDQHYHPREPRLSYGVAELWPDSFHANNVNGTLPRVFGKMPDGRIVAIGKLTPAEVQAAIETPQQKRIALESDGTQVEENPEGRLWS